MDFVDSGLEALKTALSSGVERAGYATMSDTEKQSFVELIKSKKAEETKQALIEKEEFWKEREFKLAEDTLSIQKMNAMANIAEATERNRLLSEKIDTEKDDKVRKAVSQKISAGIEVLIGKYSVGDIDKRDRVIQQMVDSGLIRPIIDLDTGKQKFVPVQEGLIELMVEYEKRTGKLPNVEQFLKIGKEKRGHLWWKETLPTFSWDMSAIGGSTGVIESDKPIKTTSPSVPKVTNYSDVIP